MQETKASETVTLQNPSTDSVAVNSAYKDLNPTQRARYDYLFPMIGEPALTLVTMLDGRGKNSWREVNQKLTLINGADFDLQRYHDACYDNFELNVVYTSQEVIGIIGEVRRELGLLPYLSSIKRNCENDFFNLFIVIDESDDETVGGRVKKKFIGYKPVFKLRPEDS